MSNEAVNVWELLGWSRRASYRWRAAQPDRIRAINRGDQKSRTEANTDGVLQRARQGAAAVLLDGQCLCSEIGSSCERCSRFEPAEVITLSDGRKLEVGYVHLRREAA